MEKELIICRTRAEVRAAVSAARKRGWVEGHFMSVGLVPTMGALHEGHLSLVRRSVEENPITVVSIFVNPTQFAPSEDFSKYPRALADDVAMCRDAGADIIFAPDASEMYAKDFSTFVMENELSAGLCGATRPGHFRGVGTVVTKLFHIIGPDRAYFGQKDAQQAAVIKRIVRDLDIPVEVIIMPIVREEDGLALSSRNKYLGENQRREAVVLSKGLRRAEQKFRKGERGAAALAEVVEATIAEAANARIDYIQVVDAETLEPIKKVKRRALVAIAVFIGGTRLIDNIILEP